LSFLTKRAPGGDAAVPACLYPCHCREGRCPTSDICGAWPDRVAHHWVGATLPGRRENLGNPAPTRRAEQLYQLHRDPSIRPHSGAGQQPLRPVVYEHRRRGLVVEGAAGVQRGPVAGVDAVVTGREPTAQRCGPVTWKAWGYRHQSEGRKGHDVRHADLDPETRHGGGERWSRRPLLWPVVFQKWMAVWLA